MGLKEIKKKFNSKKYKEAREECYENILSCKDQHKWFLSDHNEGWKYWKSIKSDNDVMLIKGNGMLLHAMRDKTVSLRLYDSANIDVRRLTPISYEEFKDKYVEIMEEIILGD